MASIASPVLKTQQADVGTNPRRIMLIMSEKEKFILSISWGQLKRRGQFVPAKF